ncbi:MAG: 3'-5' exonuclease [Cardiobacteriaceae bacterium]|nr:3'-5' exonuclease [Cardiobacteriaceae bacterium]
MRMLWNMWQRRQLKDLRFLPLFEPNYEELVSLDCETTSLNVKEAEIISIGAVKVRGGEILTSESFYVVVKPEGMMSATNVTVHGLRPKDLSHGLSIDQALYQLLDFIGGRTLLGYYLEYDVAMINKFLKPLLGIQLPQKKIEVSALYHRKKTRYQAYDIPVDLRMATMINTLKIPDLPRHDALNDAINVAMMYLAIQSAEKHNRTL